ncbi:transcriptional regulator, TetR family [Bhargavaea ginsengi]|uniref:Transcriptional regulator, TetR family n=1 Tax=Bhargavaea ginsengi TaxID=426757 RepID=A0A1H6U2Y1_9BACL|nr:TetR/AcrR family transcriptional regulator [Bhargavaea ginsengi]SEI82322.1 transcriptional regulator, TetR family [Bhargavaea ginsengi]
MTQELLLQAALQLYAKHGYQGASMRKIAEEVGIKPASIYFFFKNKEELFREVFKRTLARHNDAMRKTLQRHTDEPVEKIFAAMLRTTVDHHAGDRDEMATYISLVISPPTPDFQKQLDDYFSSFSIWLADALNDALRRDFPDITESEATSVIGQYVLLANGIFWSINIFSPNELAFQLRMAEQMLQASFTALQKKHN